MLKLRNVGHEGKNKAILNFMAVTAPKKLGQVQQKAVNMSGTEKKQWMERVLQQIRLIGNEPVRGNYIKIAFLERMNLSEGGQRFTSLQKPVQKQGNNFRIMFLNRS